MRLTVVGSGTSQPQTETPASGLLIETDTTAVLVDAGQGVIRELLGIRDPRSLDGIVIGHMHADHYIDIISLRYLLPWEGIPSGRLPVLLPPGGKARLDALAIAISERPTFFDEGFDVSEYEPDGTTSIGDLTLTFVPGQHYVPAWGCIVSGPDGARIAISGDTGPSETFVRAARGSDLVVAEATLVDGAFDDPRRGHLTPEEAVEMADQAGVAGVVLVHFRADLQPRIDALCAARPGTVAGRPGLRIDVEASRRATGSVEGETGAPSGSAEGCSGNSSGLGFTPEAAHLRTGIARR